MSEIIYGYPKSWCCWETSIVRALGHGEIKHGTYYYSDPSNPSKVKEDVRYWTKDPVYEFIQTLEGLRGGAESHLIAIW
jgi:hypothetical protein